MSIRPHRAIRDAGFAGLVLLALCGCQPGPTVGVGSVPSPLAETNAALSACNAAVDGRPEYQLLSRQMPLDAGVQPTDAQRMNEAKPSAEEATLIFWWAVQRSACRRDYIVRLRAFDQESASTVQTVGARYDAVNAALAARQVGWSEAIAMREAARVAFEHRDGALPAQGRAGTINALMLASHLSGH